MKTQNVTPWKFELSPGLSIIQVPQGAEFLSIQVQDGGIVAYFLCDPEQHTVGMKFDVVGTGDEMHRELLGQHRFLGTALLRKGLYVQHVFMMEY